MPESDQNVEISGTYKDKVLTAEYQQDGATMKVTVTSDIKKNENNYLINFDVKISAGLLGFFVDLGSFNSTTEIYFNKYIDIDLSNSKSSDEITEEEENEMMQNLQNNKLYQMVMEVINTYKPMIESMIKEQMPEYLNSDEPWNDFDFNDEEF